MAAAAAYAFDSHDFVKRLTGAGASVELAEVLAKDRARLESKIVSKDDLKELKAANKVEVERSEERTDSKFDALRKDMNAGFAGVDSKLEILKRDLTIRLGLMVISGFGALALFLK